MASFEEWGERIRESYKKYSPVDGEIMHADWKAEREQLKAWRVSACQYADKLEAEREHLIKALRRAEADRNRLLYDLEDMVNQHCRRGGELHAEDPTLDSMALSASAAAMRTLAEEGRLIIEQEYGRRVIGRWPKVRGGSSGN